MRVDADAQGTLVVHGIGQAGTEGAPEPTGLGGCGGAHRVSLSSTGAPGRDSGVEPRRDRRAAMCS